MTLLTPIVSGTGETANFKVCTHMGSIGSLEQKPINKMGKSSLGCSHTVPNILQGTHILGASRGDVCGFLVFLLPSAKSVHLF